MLPPFIIEQIRKREEEETRRHRVDQPRLELPIDYPDVPPARRTERDIDDEEDLRRGVVVLDLL
ncbi:MAG: hypothetical protein EOO75_13600 [Myxococcales bacterium]|nr:MAG: hypothetical protein EOO75_13600 [Myxococcales bacterium]